MTPSAAATAPARRPTLALLAIAGAFLALGVLTREHYGTTWDEAESYEAGRRNLEIASALLSGETATIEWPWHELRGHQLVLDTLRTAFARAATPLLPPSPAPVGERLFNLGLSTAALVVTGALAFQITGSAALGALAAAALALQPKLIAHAQNNPKDLPGLFVFALGVLLLARLERGPTPRRLTFAAVAIGLAVTTWLPAIALVPLAAGFLLAATDDPWRARLRRLAVLVAAAGAVGLASWPWLWPDPLGRLRQVADRMAEFPTGFDVLYFGRLYPSSSLPAHYTAGSLLVATPVAVVVLAALGATAALPATATASSTAAEAAAARDRHRGRRRLAAIALGWIAILLVLDAVATFHYDGVRHVLAVLPALALLAALGIERAYGAAGALLRGMGARRVAAAAGATLALALPAVLLVADLARLHPYQDSYLASPFRRLRSGASESLFEIEYWGNSYREAARWLDREAEPGATILAPIAPHCLEPYLRPDLVVRERLRPRAAATAGRPYVVFITRKAWYRELGLDQVVSSGPPLHAVRSPIGALALIYRPERIPPELTRRGGPRSWRPPRR